jgi:hypothetical protein
LDFVQYTLKAYNLLLLLVEVILRAVLGPFRIATIILLVLLVAGLGFLLWLRHRIRQPP